MRVDLEISETLEAETTGRQNDRGPCPSRTRTRSSNVEECVRDLESGGDIRPAAEKAETEGARRRRSVRAVG